MVSGPCHNKVRSPVRLGILSDTHDQLARTECAVRLLRAEGADALVHCGDLTRPDMVAVCAALPCHFAFGNHDADNVPDLQRAMAAAGAVCLGWGGEVTLGGKRVAVAHGHMTADVRRLLAARPDYLLSGHLHLAFDRRDGPTRRINPGALHEADEFTVALLDLETDRLQFLAVPG
jgi:putative phosphoesterase